MNKVTPEIVHAINSAAEKNGSLSQLAAKIKVSHGTLSRYISGKVKKISPLTWDQLLPEIAEFLPTDYISAYSPGHGIRHTIISRGEAGKKVQFECTSKEGGIELVYRGPHGVVLTINVPRENLQLLALIGDSGKENLMAHVYQFFEDFYNAKAKEYSAEPLEILENNKKH